MEKTEQRERKQLREDQRLRVLLSQETPGVWVARGLEHDLFGEARSINAALRAVLELVKAHTRFDTRHNRPPLSPFRPASRAYWDVFDAGIPVALSQLGVAPPPGWDIGIAVAQRWSTERASERYLAAMS
jgi:hypothetical protein